MELEGVTIQRKCEKCNDVRTSYINLTGGNLTIVEKSLLPRIYCNKCSSLSLKLVHAIIKKIRSDFGDVMYGVWYCPNHMTFRYYPKLLRDAVIEKDYNTQQYKMVAQIGMPLRCPFCRTPLIYTDERAMACGY